MRHAFTLLHRWVGLTIAGFLVVSGLTGAVISWDHELDELLNPHLTDVTSVGTPIPSLALAAEIEARDPRVRVSWLPLAPKPGHALAFGVDPLVDPATGRLFEPGYNQVFIDPVTGEEQGRRDWGAAWPITSETFVSFLYVLHYSLHIPEIRGIDHWGLWLLGGIALLWTVDCFVGFYLTMPARRAPSPDRPASVERQLARGFWERWKPAWRIKGTGSTYRITFDIHRAFSVWTWALLLILAFTAFSLNLYREVFYPVMALVSEVTPTPFDLRAPADKHRPIEPGPGYAAIIEQAQAEAARRGWEEPAGGAFYSQEYGIYGIGFFRPDDDHGAAGVGPAYLYYDGLDGRYLGDRKPWKGTAADIFVQAQFPLHSGRILGLPGRILISIMGLVVAAVAVTGVVVWARKRRARQRAWLKAGGKQASSLPQPAE
jgi:uncharacterized iron-regulated membrane protein